MVGCVACVITILQLFSQIILEEVCEWSKAMTRDQKETKA
jgi:hypothetical protein